MIRPVAIRLLRRFTSPGTTYSSSVAIPYSKQACALDKENHQTLRYSHVLTSTYSLPERIAESVNRLSLSNHDKYLSNRPILAVSPIEKSIQQTSTRMFHAKHSKVKYMDFRYRLPSGHLRSHLLIIRRQKMKKHQRRKWRRKYKCALAKQRLKRVIAKEKAFRVELLTMIRRAEQFDPKEYAMRKIHEINSVPRKLTPEERFEDVRELVRVNRYQTVYIKPRHKRVETFGLIEPTYQTFATKDA